MSGFDSGPWESNCTGPTQLRTDNMGPSGASCARASSSTKTVRERSIRERYPAADRHAGKRRVAGLRATGELVSRCVQPAHCSRVRGARERHIEAGLWWTPDMTSPSKFDPHSLPSKVIGSGVLLRDGNGHVLLVEPTYKDTWEIPGGVVEDGESPREAAVRECSEELGLDLTLGLPACIHFNPLVSQPRDGLMFVFDAGRTELATDDFELPPDELKSTRFVEPADLHRYTHDVMVRRLNAAIDGADRGTTVYLER